MVNEKNYRSKWDEDRIDQLFWDKITEYNKKNERFTHVIIISPYVLMIEWDGRWEKKVYLADESIPLSH